MTKSIMKTALKNIIAYEVRSPRNDPDHVLREDFEALQRIARMALEHVHKCPQCKGE